MVVLNYRISVDFIKVYAFSSAFSFGSYYVLYYTILQ